SRLLWVGVGGEAVRTSRPLNGVITLYQRGGTGPIVRDLRMRVLLPTMTTINPATSVPKPCSQALPGGAARVRSAGMGVRLSRRRTRVVPAISIEVAAVVHRGLVIV
ncbi:MAG: hypothetical protein QXR28_05470, partial [Nitrososphaerota archaeon]